MSWVDNLTREDFNRARRKAFLAQLGALLSRSSNALLSLEEVRARLNIRGQRHLGNRAVRLEQIVGSEGRYTDFDRQFAPRHEATKFRWMSVDRAHHQAVALPAVELYKLGDIYFVKDGHHRISVARLQGQAYIDAIVTELQVDVPIEADLSVRDLLLKEEYSDFLGWTGLIPEPGARRRRARRRGGGQLVRPRLHAGGRRPAGGRGPGGFSGAHGGRPLPLDHGPPLVSARA
jgi:hypothetical protein